MRKFEDLEVWQVAAELVEQLSRERRIRRSGDGIGGQIRAAAVSIGSNIAEGRGRVGDIEFHHFLSIARGSCTEVQAQLRMAFRSGNLTRERFEFLLHLAQRVYWMLSALMRCLAPP